MQESLFGFDSETPSSISPQPNDQYGEVVINGSKMFCCLTSDCGKTFRYKSEMTRHIAIHLNQRPYLCTHPGCNKTFKRNDALTNHYRVHNKKAAFTCPVASCKSEFTTKSSLRLHLLKHEGEKAFECSYPGCTQTFASHNELKEHEKTKCFRSKIEATCSHTDFSTEFFGLHNTKMNTENKQEKDLNNLNAFDVCSQVSEIKLPEQFEGLKAFEGQSGKSALQGNTTSQIDLTMSKNISDLSSFGKKSGRNLEDILISLLTYMTEENQKLRKKLKYSADVLQIKFSEIGQPQRQLQTEIKEQDEFSNHLFNQQDLEDIDAFFRSPLRREDCENNQDN